MSMLLNGDIRDKYTTEHKNFKTLHEVCIRMHTALCFSDLAMGLGASCCHTDTSRSSLFSYLPYL